MSRAAAGGETRGRAQSLSLNRPPARELDDRQRRDEAGWQRDLSHARRDAEHGRGAIVIAALAAELAWTDLLRGAPGAGPEAVHLASEATERAAKLLSKDEEALIALVRALCATMVRHAPA